MLNDEIFKACLNYNSKQAREIHDYLKSKGFSGSSVEARAFIITSLNAIYNTVYSTDDLKNIITDCDFDGGIDGFVFTKNSVDIFDFKNSDNLGLRDIQNLESRLKDLIFTPRMPFPVDEDWKAIEDSLKKYHSVENTRGIVNIYIVRLSFVKLTKSIQSVISRIETYDGVHVILIDEKQLINRMLDLKLLSEWVIPKKNINILYTRPEEKKSKGNYNALILKIPIIEILSLYKKYKLEDKDLFAKNIRIPKRTHKFSVGLEDTLKNNNNDFHLFHNGITIITTNINSDRTNYYISEPQVVNGAQTIDNIFNIYEKTKNNNLFNRSSIICKLVKADQATTNRICETSNTQKAVKVEDLRTNDTFQKELEIYIDNKSNHRYKYTRKGENIKFKNSKKIQYTTFFQWVYSALAGKPAAAKNSKRILFETSGRGEYENIQKLIIKNIKRIITLCDIGIFVEEKIKSMKTNNRILRLKKGLAKDMNLHIIAGLYLLQSKKTKQIALQRNFTNIFNILSKFFEIEQKKDPSLDSGRFFTKFDTAWVHLKNKL